MDNSTIIKQENSSEINDLQKLCRVCMQTIKRIDSGAKNIHKNLISLSYEFSSSQTKENLSISDWLKLLTNLKVKNCK